MNEGIRQTVLPVERGQVGADVWIVISRDDGNRLPRAVARDLAAGKADLVHAISVRDLLRRQARRSIRHTDKPVGPFATNGKT